jgi:hypothetical protein
MSTGAHVTSVEEVERFHAALIQFLDAADDSLLSVDTDVRRFLDWLHHEHPRALKEALNRVGEEIEEARNALNRKRLSQTGDRKPDTTEEEELLRRAKRKEALIQEKMDATKRWSRTIDRSIDDYRGSARQLGMLVESDPPPIAALMKQVLDRLSRYLEVQAPQATVLPDAKSEKEES